MAPASRLSSGLLSSPSRTVELTDDDEDESWKTTIGDDGNIQIRPDDLFKDAPIEDEDEPELSEDDLDFDDDDLAEMFRNLKEGEGDDLDW